MPLVKANAEIAVNLERSNAQAEVSSFLMEEMATKIAAVSRKVVLKLY